MIRPYFSSLLYTDRITSSLGRLSTKSDITRVSILYDVIITISNIYIVIDHCALAHDLSLFEAGDQTEVGEKGITLR